MFLLRHPLLPLDTPFGLGNMKTALASFKSKRCEAIQQKVTVSQQVSRQAQVPEGAVRQSQREQSCTQTPSHSLLYERSHHKVLGLVLFKVHSI